MSKPTGNSRRSSIETVPLLGVAVALALATIPLVAKVAGWVEIGFFVCLAVRLQLNRTGRRLPSLPVKSLLFAAGLGGVALTYGSMLGIDPGLSTLLVLVALKFLEASGERDFQVLVLLGYFLALCGLFFSQDFLAWVFVAALVGLLTTTLVRFHRGPAPHSYWRSATLSLRLFAQALPIIALLFLFFPRIYGGFRFQFSQSLLGSQGMSDRLSPGSVASLALSDQIVFRAFFPESNAPALSAMYWRAGVLWQGEGLNWEMLPNLSQEQRLGSVGGSAVLQRISVQPHGARWLFALDCPVSDLRGAIYQPGGYLQSRRAITNRFGYDVISRPENRETTLPPDQRIAALRPPSSISPRVQALVAGWKAQSAEPHAIVEAALHHFRRERFIYTLEPGTYRDATALDTFLFERRAGFCEHYAGAFTTLMRVAGIPSRIVIGYHGGEFNALGKYVIVRQADAHAWCEVWFKGSGWQRVDPTEMIAPERIASGLASYLQTRAAQTDPDAPARSLTATGWRELQRELQRDLRLVWDSINYQWDLRVLNFDEDTQRNFLFSLGLGAASWSEILIWVAIVIAVLLGLVALWMRRGGREHRDEIARAYARFCASLARAGLRREPWEGPEHFGQRAAFAFQGHAEIIREITARYIQLRYGASSGDRPALIRAVRRLPKFSTKTGDL